MKLTKLLDAQKQLDQIPIENQSIESLQKLNTQIERLIDLVASRVEALSEEDLDDCNPSQLIRLIEGLAKTSNTIAENIQRIRGLEQNHKELHQHLHINMAEDVRKLSTNELLKLLDN